MSGDSIERKEAYITGVYLSVRGTASGTALRREACAAWNGINEDEMRLLGVNRYHSTRMKIEQLCNQESFL